MPMFAENFVEEIKDRVDLYDLISPYVQLKKSGAKWVGLSPFNQEKTPSFYVDSNKGFFHCSYRSSLGTFVSAYDGALDVSIRPECIELNLDTEGNYVVKECTFYGHDQVISFQNSKGEIFRARSLPNTIYEAGDKINIEISEVTTFPSKA